MFIVYLNGELQPYIYPSIREAAFTIGVSEKTLSRHLKKGNYKKGDVRVCKAELLKQRKGDNVRFMRPETGQNF